MIESVITHDGEHFVVTIPSESMERYGFQVGDTIAFVPLRRWHRHSLRGEVQGALDDVIRNDRDAFELLAWRGRDHSERTV